MICKCLSREVYGYILVETAKNGPNLWLFVMSVCVYIVKISVAHKNPNAPFARLAK